MKVSMNKMPVISVDAESVPSGRLMSKRKRELAKPNKRII